MSLADLMKKGSLRQFATVTVATVATHESHKAPTVAKVASVAVARLPRQQIEARTAAANDTTPAPDPDRWCYPHTQAMNTGEIDTFTARLGMFTDKGVSYEDAERLADALLIRDREGDDRRLCLECAHLHGPGSLRCSNVQQAGMACDGLARDLVVILQRCSGFAGWQGLIERRTNDQA